MRRKRKKSKIGILFVALIVILASLVSIGGSYGWWYDTLTVDGDITTGNWDTCIKIRKNLEEDCPSKCDGYYFTIEVMNNGSNDLTDVEVTDSIGVRATPKPGTIDPSKGGVTWDTLGEWEINTLTWTIGDLAADETVTLSMCLRVSFGGCNYIPAEVILPEDTNGQSTYPVTRVTEGVPGSETVYYTVEHMYNSRVVKFEDCIPDGLGEDGEIETDTFVIIVSDGITAVLVTTVAGVNKDSIILQGVGDTIVDDNGFTITLVSITDLGGGQKEYTFEVTSDDIEGGQGSPALSHIEFDFGKKCTIVINEGATVTAKSIWCDLEATTEGLNIYIIKFWEPFCEEGHWVTIKILESLTPWAWDCCDICCEC